MMPETTRLRILRLKYRISLSELASKAGISHQQLSRLELGGIHPTPQQESRIATALYELVASNQATMCNLEQEVSLYENHLLELVEAQPYES